MALDVTNPEAVDWFVARLKRLQEATGIDGFKFDAGAWAVVAIWRMSCAAHGRAASGQICV